ncbi:DEAD/DEAH box helicase [Litchfieldia alkalitelluris]|uniref:DEAD/DEAH box helicase n=1 Tax=Litchfieldia alkalitelluris TaxID=304268 RepID=UPI00099829D6|nr:DEAD/DEAH box helicase [Litchfieldia alkalitelluris]
MQIEKAEALLERLESDKLIQNYFAQSDSRYILFNVQEPFANFPNYSTDLDERLTGIAMSYLSIGCSFAENKNISQSIFPLEKGAAILENIYSPIANRNEFSTYFILTSSLAFYSANQYSKSFIVLKNISFDTIIAKLISEFLRRKYSELDKSLSEIFLSGEYSDKTISELDDEKLANNRIYVLILSKSLSSLLEFIFSGSELWLKKAKEYLIDLLELLEVDAEPSLWWVIRLFMLIVDGFQENSLWKTIPPYMNGEDNTVRSYIASMAFQKSPVVEIFHSQKISLPVVLDDKGGVVSLPTSAGKTRIAEITILDCLVKGSEDKILYLAPFRSLAYEVEDSISKVFEPLGFEVSHLYGGSQFSKLDETLINESNIIIATPEKAKAILRSNSDVKSNIKLVIIDEGHLIGPEERQVLSEVFIEELRIHLNRNRGKMILLSAVLPNSSEIASWISGNETMEVNSDWRPSSQRFGLLEYTGSNVNITWKGEIESFNRSFINPFMVKRARSEYSFPREKKQAVAAASLKLSNSGSVLVFVCRKNMVLSQAQEIIRAMGEDKEEHIWNSNAEWNIFKLACDEAYGEESKVYQCAKYGVLCHHSGLPSEVRLAMEKLIRKGNPKIIVATSTLGQGVNIGVSTVIFSNVWYDGENKISNNDFWNIAGRAGRSFVDREGKILFVVDASGGSGSWSARRDRRLAFEYFESGNQDKAVSGLLHIVDYVYRVAIATDVSFETLLQMISENDYSSLEERYTSNFLTIFDWIDDTLLALNIEFNSYECENSSEWIDDYFRRSLAYIQAKYFKKRINETDIISFLKARNEGVLKLAGEPQHWKGLVSSSIPIRSGLFIRSELPIVLDIVEKYQKSNKAIEDLLNFLKETELFISRFPSKQFDNHEIDDDVRELWITGESISSLDERTLKNINEYYGYTLPWGIHAITRMLSELNDNEGAKEYETLAVLVQLGLPNWYAAKIYLAGVHSRVAATELGTALDPEYEELSVRSLKQYIIDSVDKLRGITENTLHWVSLLKSNGTNFTNKMVKIPNFIFKENISIGGMVLSAKGFEGNTFLCSPDYSFIEKVEVNKEFPFDKAENNLGVYFTCNNGEWTMQLRNPNLK